MQLLRRASSSAAAAATLPLWRLLPPCWARALTSGADPEQHEAMSEAMLAAGLDTVESRKSCSALIYAPSPSTMQQSKQDPKHRTWLLRFEPQQKWSNPLMGWTSSSDPLAHLRLTFHSKEEAVAYAKEQGIPYRLKTPNSRSKRSKSYASNFKWKGNPSDR